MKDSTVLSEGWIQSRTVCQPAL